MWKMEMDDPIQNLLKNTGWSCEELLEKLQKYKASQGNVNEKEITSSSPKEQTDVLNESTIDSTEEINKHSYTEYEKCDSSENLITARSLQEETDEVVSSNATVSEKTINEDNSLNNKPTISEESLETNKNSLCILNNQFCGINKVNSTTNVNEKYPALNDNIVTNSNLTNEEFSDTDEEENEVNATNSDIIREIIDDISTAENGEDESADKTNFNYQSPLRTDIEESEVTEVRVIEVNEEDDNFEEDDSPISLSDKQSVKNIEYLETFPRNNIRVNIIDNTENDKNNDEEYSNCNEGNEECVKEKEVSNDKIIQLLDTSEKMSIEKLNQCKEHETDATLTLSCGRTDITEDLQEPGSEEDSSETIIEEINGKDTDSNQILCHNKSETNEVPQDIEEKDPQDIEKDSQDIEEEEPKDTTVEKMTQCKETLMVPEISKNESLLVEKITTEDLQESVTKEGDCVAKARDSVQEHSRKITQYKEKEAKGATDKTEEIKDLQSPVNEEEDKSENLEDIRNSLKLQLNSLRTRKKGHFLPGLINKVVDLGFPHNKKNETHERKEKDVSSVKNLDGVNEIVPQKPSVANSIDDVLNEEGSEMNDELYTQTNELGLVILNVQGGIDLDLDDNKVDEKVTNENTFNGGISDSENLLEETAEADSNNSIQNTTQIEEDEETSVFNEIRKIIRKQKDPTVVKHNKNLPGSDEPRSNIGNFQFFSGSPVRKNEKKSSSNKSTNETINNMSTENSASSFTTEQITDKNSPFVSNTLDEFLTGNSKLNISYNVPKCGAEEGLSDHYHEVNPLVLQKVIHLDNEPHPPEQPKKIPTIKAKTVAQKRKMLERQRLKDLKKSTSKTGSVEKEKVKNDSSKLNNKKNGYILLNNKKIWVKSSRTDCIAKIKIKEEPIEVKTSLPIVQRQRKLSLLTDLEKLCKSNAIKYRPGPMCKKSFLQDSGQDEWETVTKILPKILLQVSPKIGAPFSKDVLCRLPKSDGELTEDRVEFALSVLKTKNDANVKPRTFIFPIPYRNNQEKVILRKKKSYIINTNIEGEKMCDESSSVESIVANVIDKLITYVEIKEIAPSLIKTESEEGKDSSDEPVNENIKKMPVISEHVSNILRKPQKRRSRIDLELSRLSCKVVNVEVEEKGLEEKCIKAFCRLGCVCSSLKCERLLSYHCQKHDCMLDCNCPKDKTIVYDKLTLPPGTDLLSTDTVSRIEDEAKKDLAKVEREFTQTVIHTNDKTIVVGLGGRNKARRTARVPKKYSDFVEHFENTKVVRTEVLSNLSRECFVKLSRLALTGVIPYCLIHSLYECHCQGIVKSTSGSVPGPSLSTVSSQSVNAVKPLSETSPKDIENEVEPVKIFVSRKLQIKKHKKPKLKENNNTEKLVKKIAIDNNGSPQKKENNSEETVTPITERPVRLIKKKKLDKDFAYSEEICVEITDCARTRGIPDDIKLKYPKKRKDLKKITKYDFINTLTEADFVNVDRNSSIDNRQLAEVEILKQQLINEAKKRKWESKLTMDRLSYESNKHKRKQIFEIRNEQNIARMEQGVSVLKKKKTELKAQTRNEGNNAIIEPVFDGEIIVNDSNMELLKKMGPKTVSDGYARLLPWKALVESFKNGTIKIWSMVDQPSRLLINKSDKPPPKNYVNIRQTTQASEVILWILRNKLPSSYSEDNVSFILKQTKDNYEICGICTKNLGNNGNNATYGKMEEDLLPFKHKDLNGAPQLLWLKKELFKLQELIEENLAGIGETSISKNKLYMWAALPEIYRVCKWRVIFLNSDFTYLYFTELKYSIKYTDLLSAGTIAKTENCTVRLRNQQIQEKYDHVFFGIYFEPHYQDRMFIGPYFKQFNRDDIETLRYINKSLVCTESFNKMQGKTDYKCGHWLIERPYGGTKRRLDEQTIDLTNDSDETVVATEKANKSDDESEAKNTRCSYNEKEQVISYNNEEIKVIDGKPRKPEDFNRYIITNIPHFGYLGANKHEESNGIDVCWPFENKLLRFPSVKSAVDFLQERFSSLLQPIPEAFKINVIVLNNIDLQNSKPIDASILSGQYVCGEFGCLNVKNLTKEFCIQNLGLTRESILKIFAKKAQGYLKQKIEELAALVNIDKSQLCSYNIVNILDMAQNEIKKLKEQEHSHVVMKNDLLLRKRELAMSVFCTISDMPEKQKNIENLKFRNILSNRSIAPPTDISEPIEIPDSDDENQQSSSSSSKTPENVNKPKTYEGTSGKSNLVPASITSLFPPQRNMKSVLKPISSPPGLSTSSLSLAKASILASEKPSASTNNSGEAKGTKQVTSPQPNYIKGIKIVKTNSGQLMLVSDNKSPTSPLKYSSPIIGTKVVIKNNKILSIKALEVENKGSECNPKLSPKKVNSLDDKRSECTEVNSNVSKSNS